MEIHKSAAIAFGTGGRQNTKKKQTAPRSLLDVIQIKADKVTVTLRGAARVKNAKNTDNNVHASRVDVSGSIGINNR